MTASRRRSIYLNPHTRKWVWECQVCPRRPREGGFQTREHALRAFIVEHESTPEHQRLDPRPKAPQADT